MGRRGRENEKALVTQGTGAIAVAAPAATSGVSPSAVPLPPAQQSDALRSAGGWNKAHIRIRCTVRLHSLAVQLLHDHSASPAPICSGTPTMARARSFSVRQQLGCSRRSPLTPGEREIDPCALLERRLTLWRLSTCGVRCSFPNAAIDGVGFAKPIRSPHLRLDRLTASDCAHLSITTTLNHSCNRRRTPLSNLAR